MISITDAATWIALALLLAWTYLSAAPAAPVTQSSVEEWLEE
jgi:hypothetical protein